MERAEEPSKREGVLKIPKHNIHIRDYNELPWNVRATPHCVVGDIEDDANQLAFGAKCY